LKGLPGIKPTSFKNWHQHGVSGEECEELFFNEPLLIRSNQRHFDDDVRYSVLGKTTDDRWLFMVCTIRRDRIRVISARDMSLRERRIYGKIETEEDS
jgi:uncharacterized DUF497 family protein